MTLLIYKTYQLIIQMITFKEIKYFIAVSEELNFRKAAQRLNISQPPLSQEVKILEERNGFKLLNRDKSHDS